MPKKSPQTPASGKPGPPVSESGVWRPTHGVWRKIFGDFFRESCSIEWHDFRIEESLDWAASFHEQSLEICLNFMGTGVLGGGRAEQCLEPGECAVYATTTRRLTARREGGQTHRFLTIELGMPFLRRALSPFLADALPEVRRFCAGKGGPFARVMPIPASLQIIRAQALDPPAAAGARALWYESKINEILSRLVFPEKPTGESPGQKLHRTNNERCERVLALLERDMENPPSLEMLAKIVGCSPFHLSRLFTAETGATIPATLRKLRVERAARLLRNGRGNVTEIAMRVGYSSLSAFNKAFLEHTGRTPGDFLNSPPTDPPPR